MSPGCDDCVAGDPGGDLESSGSITGDSEDARESINDNYGGPCGRRLYDDDDGHHDGALWQRT